MQNKIINLLLVPVMLFCACSPDSKSKNSYIGDDSLSICFKNPVKSGFKIGTSIINRQILPDIIECKGHIYPSPNEVVVVSTPMEGIIKQLNISSGDYVQKGSILAIIENTEFLRLQEEYLIAKSQFEYNKEDFKRQGELNLENATSMKVMQKAQYEFKKSEANLNSLKKRLIIIGIEPDSINAENLLSTIKIPAPISGYTSQVGVHKGMFCTKTNTLCKISGSENPILYFRIEEEKANDLAVGQSVEFTITGQQESIYKAEIKSVDFLSDKEENIYSVYCKILTTGIHFKLGSPAQTYITTGEKLTIIVPNQSIVTKAHKDFVIIKTSEDCFKALEITIGRNIDSNRVTINILKEISDSEIVVEGTQGIFKLLDKISR